MSLFSTDVPHDVAAVTPSDTNDLAKHRGLWVSVAGTLVVMNQGGVTIPMGDLPVGTLVPGRYKRVMEATGATVVRLI